MTCEGGEACLDAEWEAEWKSDRAGSASIWTGEAREDEGTRMEAAMPPA